MAAVSTWSLTASRFSEESQFVAMRRWSRPFTATEVLAKALPPRRGCAYGQLGAVRRWYTRSLQGATKADLSFWAAKSEAVGLLKP